MKRKIVSVWEVNQYVSRLIEEDYTLGDLWLQGEVSNCKYHHSGHVYFTIKDARASIQAFMFERDARRLSFRLEEGMKIYARVRITIYELKFTDVPQKVAVNEAVEIAKVFSTEKSPKFINGILGSVIKETEA